MEIQLRATLELVNGSIHGLFDERNTIVAMSHGGVGNGDAVGSRKVDAFFVWGFSRCNDPYILK